MATGSAASVADLVDQAVERLLKNSQAVEFLSELHHLRSENAELKASLALDNKEISRLWALIGEGSLGSLCFVEYDRGNVS